jgi:putative ABC transport system permease protein
MQTLKRDLAFAIRSLRNHPAFALTAILTLALGIGASTAIFSVVNAVLLRPLPYAQAERLVLVWRRCGRATSASSSFRRRTSRT